MGFFFLPPFNFLNDFNFFHYSWLQCSVNFLLYSKVTQSHTHTHTHIYSFSHIIVHHVIGYRTSRVTHSVTAWRCFRSGCGSTPGSGTAVHATGAAKTNKRESGWVWFPVMYNRPSLLHVLSLVEKLFHGVLIVTQR